MARSQPQNKKSAKELEKGFKDAIYSVIINHHLTNSQAEMLFDLCYDGAIGYLHKKFGSLDDLPLKRLTNTVKKFMKTELKDGRFLKQCRKQVSTERELGDEETSENFTQGDLIPASDDFDHGKSYENKDLLNKLETIGILSSKRKTAIYNGFKEEKTTGELAFELGITKEIVSTTKNRLTHEFKENFPDIIRPARKLSAKNLISTKTACIILAKRLEISCPKNIHQDQFIEKMVKHVNNQERKFINDRDDTFKDLLTYLTYFSIKSASMDFNIPEGDLEKKLRQFKSSFLLNLQPNKDV